MLRRLEKGLNTAKMKSQPTGSTSPFQTEEMRPAAPQQSVSYHPDMSPSSHSTYAPPPASFAVPESPSIPPRGFQPYHQSTTYAPSSSGRSHVHPDDDDDDDQDKNDEAFIPAKLIKRESLRNSFFRTILNPEKTPATIPGRSNSFTPPQTSSSSPTDINDPIAAGIITDAEAKTLFDAFFLRLNPFINLFDPVLHTVTYVRSRCSFLFTVLIMSACKFFKVDKYKQCQKLTNEFANRAFAENWRGVEVAQAFVCMTYWKEPDDTVGPYHWF